MKWRSKVMNCKSWPNNQSECWDFDDYMKLLNVLVFKNVFEEIG
jgi:hypothetical protein